VSRLRRSIGPEDHLSGRADAEVQLVEYGDFECPICGQLYWELKRTQLVLGERLVFVFRHFPLTQIHSNALHAAEAAESAASQGRFWDMHDLLFQYQSDLEPAALFSYADELGLDLARFTREMDGHEHQARIERDFMSGTRSGVAGSPGLFLNGELHSHASWTRALETLIGESPSQPR
jgi:protein-disulfide isomerase